MNIIDPAKQALHDTVIRNKHQAIGLFMTTGTEQQYRFVDMPVAITLGKVKSALKSLSTKGIRQGLSMTVSSTAAPAG
ncbi:MAG TPA: hypothetical protein ENI94_03615 [Gammaproteobacteria bacterium]|nr:hypothetical protein [Gammaproteobacteria bacterium]